MIKTILLFPFVTAWKILKLLFSLFLITAIFGCASTNAIPKSPCACSFEKINVASIEVNHAY